MLNCSTSLDFNEFDVRAVFCWITFFRFQVPISKVLKRPSENSGIRERFSLGDETKIGIMYALVKIIQILVMSLISKLPTHNIDLNIIVIPKFNRKSMQKGTIY